MSQVEVRDAEIKFQNHRCRRGGGGQMRAAESYPKYCPNCGAQRMLQDPVILPAITFIGETEEITTPAQKIIKSVPYCTRCGFMWENLLDPGSAIKLKLAELNDQDLFQVMQFFYNIQKSFISELAIKIGKNMSTVQRVLQGDRASAPTKQAIVQEFRKRIQESGVAAVV